MPGDQPPRPLPPGGWMDLPGRGRLWVWDSGGELPPVVLVHGFTSTAALTWSATMAPLSARFRVVAPDQRGHGRGLRTRRFSLEECADDLAAVILHLGCGPAVVAGYSMGGPIALHTWHRHPEVVGGLVLAATAARFSGRTGIAPAVTAVGLGLSSVLAALPRSWTGDLLARMSAARDPDPARARWVRAEQAGSDLPTLVQAAAALNAYDASGWINEVDVPTAVIVTSRDETVSPAAQWHLARTVPGATATSLAAGHRACVDHAGEFAPLLAGACAAVSRPPCPGGGSS